MPVRSLAASLAVSLICLGAASLARYDQLGDIPALYAAPLSTAQAAFDPYGYYFFAGRPPRVFAEIDSFQLELVPGRTQRSRSQPAGSISVKRGSAHCTFADVTVTRQQLTFSTAVEGGISYHFSGRFVRPRTRAGQGLALAGTLTKLRDSQPVAEAPVRFTAAPFPDE